MAKELSKVAKIAIGVVAGVTATTAIVVPTTIVMTRRGEEDSGYSITLDYNLDGMENEQITVAEGTKIADLTTKPVEGYSFAGWFKDEACTQKYADDDVITADSTIFAKYEILKFLVSFPEGEHFSIVNTTGEAELDSGEVEYGSSISFKVSLDADYNQSQITVTVNGETITPNGEDVYTVANIKDNIVVNISGVEVNSAVVTMNIDGVESSQEMEYGQFFSNDAITSDNSLGWYTDENFTNLFDPTTTPITENITLFTKMATLDVLEFETINNLIIDEEVMTAIITNFNVQEIVVPLTYNGEKVVAVGAEYKDSNTTLQNVVLSKSVEIIGNQEEYAGNIYGDSFENCTELKSINLENVKYICREAFYGCSNLDVDFSKLTNLEEIGSSAFAETGVTEFVPCENLTVIGSEAFANSKLNYIKLSSSVNGIGRDAFTGLTSLKRLDLSNVVDIPSGYGYGLVFSGATSLSEVILSENITTIATNAFSGCESLETINLENATDISVYAFAGCSSLDVDFSKLTNLQGIGEYAFAGSGVTEFNPASALQSVGRYAFSGCVNLKTVIINHNLSLLQFSQIFSDCVIDYFYVNTNQVEDLIGGCQEIEQLVIGKNVTEINFLDSAGFMSGNGGLYSFGVPVQIVEILFEQDDVLHEINVQDVALYCDTIVCDSQSYLNSLISNGFDFAFAKLDTGYPGPQCINMTAYSLYIKDTLEGADTLDTATSEIVGDRSVITKEAESDREGYIKYTVAYNTES